MAEEAQIEEPQMDTTDLPEPEQPEEPVYAIPDMIRILGGGQIGVDDERWLGVSIPAGTAFYSEDVVSKLREELADATELAATLRQAVDDAPEPQRKGGEGVNMKGFLMSLPIGNLLDLSQAALNCLTMRQLAEACYDAGIKPSFHLVDAHG